MNTLEVAPYFHPTQIVLVDDDIDFLGNLSLQLDADLAYLLFDSTQKALDYINERQNGTLMRDRLFRGHALKKAGAPDDRDRCERVDIDLDALYRKMHSSDRFSEISVVLVDYAMPQMNGLDLCQQIDDPHIKKILFTGVATESLAVEAFNNGIIDQYIRKHEHSVYERLNNAIRRFQRDYIRDLFVNASDVLPLNVPPMLEEPATAALLGALEQSHGLIEYYLTGEPSGFYFATASGQLKHVVVMTPAELTVYAASLADKIPAEWRDGIQRAELVPHPELRQWLADPARAYPKNGVANALTMPNGDTARRWAVFDVSLEGRDQRITPSYNEFLEWLDTVGYSMM